MFLHKRIRFFCFFIYPLSFANCLLTATLREKQKRMSFYEYDRPDLDGIRVSQDNGHPILELSYIRGNEKKINHYCAAPSETESQKKDIYIFTMFNFADSNKHVNSKTKIQISQSG
ncbi:hypothetical protein LEP1GSC045_4157 [Leptospira interrogans serovar Pomona str. Kennewicki LC82-25]|nr:hypothetical protein LEP1GSC045_4157 [Leptospira interrogans serovar Pomona str. Kennewicki LC82-25]EKN99095.1 hypothetical protein LEP1GSC014_1439 [Leptospira interrogans serovar Pomona str. Pomona]EMF33647.1 hypothetical protein LEP1GSC201_4046 [Leptospira interrogans serovar Pomona str. Fox 32256]EMI65370.1 hypothetical protein LEP1GSC200_2204 [Leptospira interrogans serovar Pomona str. CSL10083]EMJ60805.1 hypothetical protein LEP1GSC197_3252 [Leptospira interrogans serovar Pomona str. CS